MIQAPHAPSRRELLLASGVLFAWAHLPRVALAEGRDPRLLVIVLRGALDGLATVAPVGDPDWLRLRGDEALTLEFATPSEAHARVNFTQDLLLEEDEPTQHRPSKAYLFKLWWEGSANVMAWTDWARAYTHAAIAYQPRIRMLCTLVPARPIR